MTSEQVTDPVGLRTYSPTEEACRKAPALVCAVASRVLRLREAIRTGKPYRIEDVTAPLPFEADLLSGDIGRVNAALESA